MNSRKKPEPPDMSGLKDDWNQMSRLRRESEGTDPQNSPEPSPPAPARPQTPRTKAPPESPVMSRRSWYAEKEAVEALAEAVEDLHFATRVPKHTIVSELFRQAAAAAPKVQKKLSR